MGAKTPFSRPESDVFFVKLSFLADDAGLFRKKPTLRSVFRFAEARSFGSMIAPNLLSGFNDQTQFVSLRFDGNVVAVNGA